LIKYIRKYEKIQRGDRRFVKATTVQYTYIIQSLELREDSYGKIASEKVKIFMKRSAREESFRSVRNNRKEKIVASQRYMQSID